MKYEMQFCVACYLPEALALAQSLLESAPHDENLSLELVPGKSGSFDIRKDQQLIFSKKTSGMLPTAQDLGLASLRSVLPIAQTTAKKCC